MGKVKKVSVGIGIAVGSVIGGTISFIGKMTEKEQLDRLGENIMDSTILTGEIAGDAASGVTRIVSGKLQRRSGQVEKGKRELAAAGEHILENAVENVRNVANQGEEILEGVRTHDRERVNRGLCTLGKMAVVGALTVGAVKVDQPEAEDDSTQLDLGQDESIESTEAAKDRDAESGSLETEMCAEAEATAEADIADEYTETEADKIDTETDQAVSEEELEKIIRF